MDSEFCDLIGVGMYMKLEIDMSSLIRQDAGFGLLVHHQCYADEAPTFVATLRLLRLLLVLFSCNCNEWFVTKCSISYLEPSAGVVNCTSEACSGIHTSLHEWGGLLAAKDISGILSCAVACRALPVPASSRHG